MKSIVPIAEFKVFPMKGHRGRLHYIVQAFEAMDQMHAYCKLNCPVFMGKDALACCHSHTVLDVFEDGEERVKSLMGSIHFSKELIGGGMIAHECTHATFYWFRRRFRKNLHFSNRKTARYTDGDEELFCWVVGNLTAQIFAGMYKHKVW